MELQMRAYTIRAHGATVARTHLHDWLILILLAGIVALLYFIEPFYRYVSKDMMTNLKYPLKPNAIPVWSVPIYSVVLPIIVFVIHYCKRKDVHDLHHAILGILYSVVITGVFTEAIKDSVGRPRPNFFWRCFPDGEEAYDGLGNVVCHGDHSIIKEGYKSFPSGHTSWSFAGLGFLSLYLSGKIRAFDQAGHAAKLCIVLLPLLAAALVAVSRVDDYWHHWQDVFAGALIGIVITFICYLQFFPLPHQTLGWGPYAYFKAVEQDAQAGPPARTADVQAEGDGSSNSCLSLVHQQKDHKITMD